MRKNIFLIVVILTFFAQKILSQDITVVSRLDTNTMLIGDQVRFHIGITAPANSLVRWPLIGDTILGHIRVLNRSRIDTAFSADKKSIRLNQSFLLTTFDSGYFAIPPVRFYVQQPPDTTKIVHQSESAFLNVHSVHVDTTLAIKPIKGPIKIPISFREMLPWIIGGILVIALTGFFIYWFKRRKKAEPVFRLKPRIIMQPHETALMELEKLRVKKLWQSGKIKEYHSELTEIVRKYIEERFGIMALEMTSDEIIESLKERIEISKSVLDKLVRVFTMADLVKFAKEQPLPSEHELSIEQAVTFVKDTILRIVEQNEGKEKKEEPALIN
jgi:hypothetical protein